MLPAIGRLSRSSEQQRQRAERWWLLVLRAEATHDPPFTTFLCSDHAGAYAWLNRERKGAFFAVFGLFSMEEVKAYNFCPQDRSGGHTQIQGPVAAFSPTNLEASSAALALKHFA